MCHLSVVDTVSAVPGYYNSLVNNKKVKTFDGAAVMSAIRHSQSKT